MPHRPRLERNRQRAAVGPVMVEIDQHQSAGEKLVEHRTPTLFGGEQLVPVEQHQLVRIGPDQADIPPPERPVLVDRTVGGIHPLRKGVRIGQHLEGVADQRPAPLARDMVQRVRWQLLAPVLGHAFGASPIVVGAEMAASCAAVAIGFSLLTAV